MRTFTDLCTTLIWPLRVMVVRLRGDSQNAFGGAYYPLDQERGVGRAIIDWEGEPLTIDVAQFAPRSAHRSAKA